MAFFQLQKNVRCTCDFPIDLGSGLPVYDLFMRLLADMNRSADAAFADDLRIAS